MPRNARLWIVFSYLLTAVGGLSCEGGSEGSDAAGGAAGAAASPGGEEGGALGAGAASAGSGGAATAGSANDGQGANSSGVSGGQGASGGTGASGGMGASSGTGASGGMAGGSGAAGSAGGDGASDSGGSGGVVAGETGEFSVTSTRADELNPEAPGTVFVVTWSVALPAVEEAVIHFGPDTNYGMSAPVDLEAPDFRTLLLGMTPSTTYHFQIVAKNAGQEYVSPDFEVETGPATNLVTLSDFEVIDEQAYEAGFIVAAVGTTAIIVGPTGDVVWWYQTTVGDLVTAVRLAPDGKSIWLAPRWLNAEAEETGPLERVTLDTLETQIYENTAVSHDLSPVVGKTMAYIHHAVAGEVHDHDESEDAGAEEDHLCFDSLIELDDTGTKKTIWEAGEYLDDCHVNAVRYNAVEDVYAVSDRSSTVFVINRAGEVLWRLDDLVSNTEYGEIQHGSHILEHSLLTFANLAERRNSIVYEFDRADGSILYEYDGGEFSNTLSAAQRLPGGNTFVVYSNAGAIHQADAQGNTVMRLQTEPTGYAAWRASLYGAPSDTVTW